jgi:hypothetical protein
MKIVAVLLVGSIAGWSPLQSPPDEGLARLTVPAQRLPKDCRLEPVGKDERGQPSILMGPGRLDVNPWIGWRQPTVALIRESVEARYDPEYRGPEGLRRLAEGTIDGYIAQYITSDGGKILVYAVRFDDPSLTARAATMRLDGDAEPRIILGATAVSVRWTVPSSRLQKTDAVESCARAVRQYIALLK